MVSHLPCYVVWSILMRVNTPAHSKQTICGLLKSVSQFASKRAMLQFAAGGNTCLWCSIPDKCMCLHCLHNLPVSNFEPLQTFVSFLQHTLLRVIAVWLMEWGAKCFYGLVPDWFFPLDCKRLDVFVCMLHESLSCLSFSILFKGIYATGYLKGLKL